MTFTSAVAPHGLHAPVPENDVPGDWIDPFLLGLRDCALDGWYSPESGEVLPGFPVGRGNTVVDVGCGDGGTAGFCAELGARVILADSDAARLAGAGAWIARSIGQRPDVIVTDSNPLPLRDGLADRVLCMEVLEHVDDPPRLMTELARIGAPGARYLLTVPDPAQESLQKLVARPEYFQRPYHLRIFGRDDFAALVEGAGLRIEKRVYYGAFWSMWWLLFWQAGADDPVTGSKDALLQSWTRTWRALLASDGGMAVKHVLDNILPKSQAIIAVK